VGGQRATVADAGGAAVADDVEAQLVEIGQQASLLVVVGDHARARRERGLDPRRNGEAFFDGFLRKQAGGDHHRWVRRVRATGDGGNNDGAMIEVTVGVDVEPFFHGGGDVSGDGLGSGGSVRSLVVFNGDGGIGDDVSLPRGGGAR